MKGHVELRGFTLVSDDTPLPAPWTPPPGTHTPSPPSSLRSDNTFAGNLWTWSETPTQPQQSTDRSRVIPRGEKEEVAREGLIWVGWWSG